MRCLRPRLGKKWWNIGRFLKKKPFQNLTAQLELCDTHALQHLLSCWFQNPSGPTSGIVDFWGSSAIQKKQGLNFPTIPFKEAPKNINSFPEKSSRKGGSFQIPFENFFGLCEQLGPCGAKPPATHISEAWGLLLLIPSSPQHQKHEYICTSLELCDAYALGWEEKRWNIARFLPQKPFQKPQGPTGVLLNSTPPSSLELPGPKTIGNNLGDCRLLGVLAHQKRQGQDFPTIPFKQAPKNI